MTIEILTSYALFSLLMGLIPGPSVLFTAAYSFKYNLRNTYNTVLGQLTANLIFLSVIFIGIDSLPESFFNFVKTLGSIYIIYLGVKIYKSNVKITDEDIVDKDNNFFRSYIRGLSVGISNPKLILHFGAILPQFMSNPANRSEELIILSVVSLIIATIVLSIYALIPVYGIKRFLTEKHQNNFIKISGIIMVITGVLLFLK